MIVVHRKCATQNVEWMTDCVRVNLGLYGSSHGLTPNALEGGSAVVEHGGFGFVFLSFVSVKKKLFFVVSVLFLLTAQ